MLHALDHVSRLRGGGGGRIGVGVLLVRCVICYKNEQIVSVVYKPGDWSVGV